MEPSDFTLTKAVEMILAPRGLRQTAPIRQFAGGANNRVYCATAGGQEFLVKQYFTGETDTRDRFAREQAFYTLLWSHHVRHIPEPIGWDPVHRLGVFEYVVGDKLQPGDVGVHHVHQALEFLQCVNGLGPRAAAAEITPASEACFTVEQHLQQVDRRIAVLGAIGGGTPADAAAATWIRTALVPAWDDIRSRAVTAACAAGVNCRGPLDSASQVLSPSDFGFHNAILTAAGTLCFFDFEYSGWDDPAKTICDFLCQPQVPVPGAHAQVFADGVAALVVDSISCRHRADVLLPVYCVKWCCIMLNEFVSTDRQRRRFSVGDVDMEARKASQLERASRALVATRYAH